MTTYKLYRSDNWNSDEAYDLENIFQAIITKSITP